MKQNGLLRECDRDAVLEQGRLVYKSGDHQLLITFSNICIKSDYKLSDLAYVYKTSVLNKITSEKILPGKFYKI